MNYEQFDKLTNNWGKKMQHYGDVVFPRRAGEISLRFIDNNFRTQGWNGNQFQPWKPINRKGKILIKSGTLMRGTSFTTQPRQTRVFNNVSYARVHNNGFYGTVNVRAYQRKNFRVKAVNTGRLSIKGKQGVKNVHEVSATVNVRAHTRQMNIPQRQFMPNSISDAPRLVAQIRADMSKQIMHLFK